MKPAATLLLPLKEKLRSQDTLANKKRAQLATLPRNAIGVTLRTTTRIEPGLKGTRLVQPAAHTNVLLKARASLDAVLADGSGVLHCAAHVGSLPLCQALRAAGARCDAVSARGRTVLHTAAAAVPW